MYTEFILRVGAGVLIGWLFVAVGVVARRKGLKNALLIKFVTAFFAIAAWIFFLFGNNSSWDGFLAALVIVLFSLGAVALGESKIITEEEDSLTHQGKQCPFCAETIKAKAIKCRFCGSVLNHAEIEQNRPSEKAVAGKSLKVEFGDKHRNKPL
jgi:hypothetical protein